ncbi:hypothetical protein GCM10011613_00520 [Cellvibrio zantedeschiae]|uniref:Transcription regulator MerR DNA binding domain-containing protein n=1 Tax=Cellvibrio zantedeschiae TaxID=1237077 RepID=A0ABQ3AMI9_9GAMM|nr:MerR family DNA-binding protein [Cellvibrio zantedeschiae]GGY61065.1 hypothetical protein GCM10011613_00520 [Cellvibrio zantedeschiae]
MKAHATLATSAATRVMCYGGFRLSALPSVGIPLKQINDALASLPHNTSPTQADWKKLSTDWRKDLDLRILQLQKLRNTLDDCIGCGCLSIERCRLRNPLDQLADEGPGAHYLWIKEVTE